MLYNRQRLHSVIVPVYNGGHLLEEAILSILAQTYSRIEIIVVDDGSTDAETRRTLNRYRHDITTIHKKNGGTGSALNAGFGAANGDFLHWLSHDDLYFPSKIAEFDAAIEECEGLENVVCYGSWCYIDLYGQIIGNLNINEVLPREISENPYWPLLLGVANGCAISFAKTLFDVVGQFREDLVTTQDYDYWLRLFPVAKMKQVQEIKVAHRLHEGQGSRTIKFHTKEADFFYCNLLKLISNNPIGFLSLPPLVSLSRIEKHLSPSNYENAKIMTKEMIQKYTTEILIQERMEDNIENRRYIARLAREECDQFFGVYLG